MPRCATTRQLQIAGRFAALAGLVLLSGCNTLGSIGSRSDNINKTTAGYASNAILLNVLRAIEAEPLQFVSLTSVTGHNTVSATLGLPTIAIGSGQTATQRLFLFGPNSIGGSESSDFNLSVVDDPQTFAALLRPVDPATLGFFINQGYEQSILFFLFISRMRVYDATGTIKKYDYYEDLISSAGNAINPKFKDNFYTPLLEYINAGLAVQVDPTYIPQPGRYGPAKMCFDEKWFDPSPDAIKKPDPLHRRTDCATILRPADQARPAASAAAAHTSAPEKAGRKPSTTPPATPPPAEAQAITSPDFTFTDQDGDIVQVETRSLMSAYRFLGELGRISRLVSAEDLKKSGLADLFDDDPAARLIDITTDLTGCWAGSFFEGKHWCVPSEATKTKRVFAILHQLFELYANPNNQPATQTVRVTP